MTKPDVTAFPVTLGGEVFRILPIGDPIKAFEWGQGLIASGKAILESSRVARASRNQWQAEGAFAMVRNEFEKAVLGYTKDIPLDAIRRATYAEAMNALQEMSIRATTVAAMHGGFRRGY